MKRFLLFNIFFCLILCSACGTTTHGTEDSGHHFLSKEKNVTVSGFMLNTYVSITLYGTDNEELAKEALRMCSEYEQIFSRTIPDSDLSLLNTAGETVHADEALYELVQIGLYYGGLTDGALDITIEPLSSLWDVGGVTPHVPDERQIAENLSFVDYRNVKLTEENQAITLQNNASLDLGAIAKGYIADKIRQFLIENGAAHGIINLGGNILCIHDKPDGSDYIIGIQKPFDEAAVPILTLKIDNLSVVTSGTYERYFTEDNHIYHHIIDPETGYPSDSGLTSVTIISDTSAAGDCLSTACMIMGADKALKLLNSIDGVYGILIDDRMNIIYSEGASQFVR